MKTYGKNRGRAMPLPMGAALGALYGFLWTLIGSGILSWMFHKEWVEMESVGYGSMVILLTASILAGLTGYRKVKRRRLLTCISSGMGYLLMLLALTALFFGGQYSGVGVTALLILGGSAAAVFIGMESERGNRKGRKIHVK